MRTRSGFVVRHLGINDVSAQFNCFAGTIDRFEYGLKYRKSAEAVAPPK